MSADQKIRAAASVLGQALFGINHQSELSVDIDADPDTKIVSARVEVESGDVYELTVRWVEEESP